LISEWQAEPHARDTGEIVCIAGQQKEPVGAPKRVELAMQYTFGNLKDRNINFYCEDISSTI
jgi:hypothetical protein